VLIFAGDLFKILEMQIQFVATIKIEMIPTVLVTRYAFHRNRRGL